MFYTEIDDHSVSRGDILVRGRFPVASKASLDMLHWATPLAPYRLIRMAIEMAHNGGIFVHRHRFFV